MASAGWRRWLGQARFQSPEAKVEASLLAQVSLACGELEGSGELRISAGACYRVRVSSPARCPSLEDERGPGFAPKVAAGCAGFGLRVAGTGRPVRLCAHVLYISRAGRDMSDAWIGGGVDRCSDRANLTRFRDYPHCHRRSANVPRLRCENFSCKILRHPPSTHPLHMSLYLREFGRSGLHGCRIRIGRLLMGDRVGGQ